MSVENYVFRKLSCYVKVAVGIWDISFPQENWVFIQKNIEETARNYFYGRNDTKTSFIFGKMSTCEFYYIFPFTVFLST